MVVDTGPLIALAAGEVLHLLRDLPHEFLVPGEVKLEIESGERLGHGAVDLTGSTVIEMGEPLDAVTVSLLDRGEAAVIRRALDSGIGVVCIDEKKGRRLARAVGLDVVGTLGLLLEAKQLGIIDDIAPVIERLLRFGIWYDRGLLERVLSYAGETLPETEGR